MKVKTRKNILIGMLVVLTTLLCSVAGILCSNHTMVYAAGNTDINDISLIEYTNHTLRYSFLGC